MSLDFNDSFLQAANLLGMSPDSSQRINMPNTSSMTNNDEIILTEIPKRELYFPNTASLSYNSNPGSLMNGNTRSQSPLPLVIAEEDQSTDFPFASTPPPEFAVTGSNTKQLTNSSQQLSTKVNTHSVNLINSQRVNSILAASTSSTPGLRRASNLDSNPSKKQAPVMNCSICNRRF